MQWLLQCFRRNVSCAGAPDRCDIVNMAMMQSYIYHGLVYTHGLLSVILE
jgi:hypothetical protein